MQKVSTISNKIVTPLPKTGSIIDFNLIESYDRLMAFVNKHLPDTFYLEGDIRISIRDKIFRKVISNILIHRDYGNPF